MKHEMVCILCPVGCALTVAQLGGAVEVAGNECTRGKGYGVTELTNPMRVVTSSVLLINGERPLVSVKTKDAVPKAMIPEVLKEIRDLRYPAPVTLHDVLIANVADTGVDVIATYSVAKNTLQ